MNTVRISVSPEDIVKNIAALPKGGLVQVNSIRAIGGKLEFDYHHPEIQHPFEVMELRAWIALDRGHAAMEAAPCKPVLDLTPAVEEKTTPENTENTEKPTRKKK